MKHNVLESGERIELSCQNRSIFAFTRSGAPAASPMCEGVATLWFDTNTKTIDYGRCASQQTIYVEQLIVSSPLDSDKPL